ncbi:endolytic transglycosylase MltG [Clostridia bacterium]|nr:endolytic transglycosylase MltG [Clostridia bacterium]
MKILKLLLLFILIGVLAVAGLFFYVSQQLSAPTMEGLVSLTVDAGETPRQVAENLEELQVIRNADIFYYWMRYFENPADIKAGEYQINRPMEKEEIFDLLKRGKVKEDSIRVTIPEGLKVDEIIEILVEKGLGSTEVYRELCMENFGDYDFLPEKVSPGAVYLLEGYLFPDTYDFFTDATEEDVLNKLLMRFKEIYSEDFQARAIELGYSDYQIVTMASIVEKEAKLDSERATIAGVFYNRLAMGMALQSCATIQFLFEEPKERLFNSDLEIESPYNTYQIVGLPPGPIASPGRKSIEAALWPEKHNYLYFVANDDGSHDFNKTFSEHVEDKNDE